MAISFEAQVTEVTSASLYKDKVKRATIRIKDANDFNREITVRDTEDNLYLDRYIMVTIESYTEFHDRHKVLSEREVGELLQAQQDEILDAVPPYEKGGDINVEKENS